MGEVFTAEISGIRCSLYLVMNRKGLFVKKKKSTVECITNQTMAVNGAFVINSNTDHIFKLSLIAKVNKKAKLIKGQRFPNPTDINMATKSILHRGPEDEDIGKDLALLLNQLNENPAEEKQ